MSAIEQTIKALNKSGFTAKHFDSMNDAKQAILDLISVDESVSTGGSVTLIDSGILKDLNDRGNTLITTSINPPDTRAEQIAVRKKGLFADWFLTSTNAVTLGGDLVNIDGTGNRVASMVFGPPKTLVLAGKNKITKDPIDAIARIKHEVCGKNARRLNLDLPCAKDDQCHECKKPNKMCKIVMRMEHPPFGKEAVYVFIVNEDWGY